MVIAIVITSKVESKLLPKRTLLSRLLSQPKARKHCDYYESPTMNLHFQLD